MKDRLFNILLVLLVFLALFGIFKLKGISKKNVERIISETESNIVVPVREDPLSEILNDGSAAKCQFAKNLINSKMSVEFFIEGENIRADVTAPDKDGVERLTHTIIKDKTMYVWYDGGTSGMKMSEEDTLESSGSQALDLQNFIGIDDTLDYKCDEWKVDSFKFVVPPEITFVDGVAFINELDRQLCLLCDREDSEASRLLCRQELKCK